MALSALHLLQGLAPSHFDFFNLQRSQALQTRFLILSWVSIESVLWGDMVGWCERGSGYPTPGLVNGGVRASQEFGWAGFGGSWYVLNGGKLCKEAE